MRRYILFLVALTALVTAPAAFAWRAQNGNEVKPVSKSVFEVVARGRSGAADFWCGAGDYALRVLGAAATQRIYIWQPIGASVTMPGDRAVQFSFSAPKGADTSTGYSLSVKRAGDNLTAAAAQQYCRGQYPVF